MENRTAGTRIYVAVNRNQPCIDAPGYVILQVGRAGAAETFGHVGDDTGDNISRLNPSFCEMTGLYWLWKNTNSHIVGLAHYRRYFTPREQPGVLFGEHHVAQSTDFAELAGGVDLVVPNPIHWRHNEIPENLIDQYGHYHYSHDMFLAREEVLARTPDYRDAFDWVMNSNVISHHNMFVGRKAVIDEYCAWVFPILFAIERFIPYEFYDGYQSRVMGFIAERLFNVWLCKNRRRFRILQRSLVRTEAGIL